ncbi:MAG: 30S ribosomal protein S17 [Chloroflexi bacterium]|nr:30S ribosomal protein S17 [Chloroflexota bacterium]|tara:strand:- start:1104 stop:1529 length:426 start_codon:yes stop_codon:yes gene_type:complete
MDDNKNINRKSRLGLVVSDIQDKTVIVNVARNVRHPIYHKVLKRTKKYQVHDPENRATIGDIVRIEETNPISKNKRWKLTEVVTDRDVAGIAATEIDSTLVSEIEQSTKQNLDEKNDNDNVEENDKTSEEESNNDLEEDKD